MRKPIIVAVLVAGLFGASAMTAVAGPPTEATVRFGNNDVGSGLNDPANDVFHDASFKANDKIYPRTVVISAGGSVDFNVEGFHQVAVCGEGVELGDLTVPEFPPELFVNDPQCPASAPPTVSTTVDFSDAGTYLVICNVTPHLTEAGMYSYVIVK